MKDDKLLTDDYYGAVKKAYVVAKDDKSLPVESQSWMIALSPDTEVEEITGADHFVMCYKPR